VGKRLANVKSNRSYLNKRQKGKLTPASSDVGADLRSEVLVVDGIGEQKNDTACTAQQDERGNHANQDGFFLRYHEDLLVG
jgi:hypothetical protein